MRSSSIVHLLLCLRTNRMIKYNLKINDKNNLKIEEVLLEVIFAWDDSVLVWSKLVVGAKWSKILCIGEQVSCSGTSIRKQKRRWQSDLCAMYLIDRTGPHARAPEKERHARPPFGHSFQNCALVGRPHVRVSAMPLCRTTPAGTDVAFGWVS
jgi:hypothetical protein